jgi:hypothetical protein
MKELSQPRRWTAEVIRLARDKALTPGGLSLALKNAGLVSPKTGEAYSDQAINNWARGDNPPDADVLLAAAHFASVKIDQVLYGESIVERVDRLETQVREILEEVRKAR